MKSDFSSALLSGQPDRRDRFGYYRVGNFKTYSKMEAIELHARTGIHPHWDFNESVFLRYDWTKEPVESLWDLYAKRAREIRAKYDYVVLNYSGGADSHMMVRAFLENDIPVDEIITCHYGGVDNRMTGFCNIEPFQHALPQAQQWQAQGYKFLHRMVDYGTYIRDAFHDSEILGNWIYYHNNNYGLTRIGRSLMREKDPHYRQLEDQGLRVVFVSGVDKPRLYKDQGRYCLRFLDMLDNWIPARTLIKNRPEENDECFYWSPDSVDMLCKQAHTLMKFFKSHEKSFDEFSERNFFDKKPYQQIKVEDIFHLDKNSAMSITNAELVHYLIYPGHRPVGTRFKFFKVFVSLLDEIFHLHPEYKARMQMHINKLHSIDPYWLKDGDVKLMISPPYYLEPPCDIITKY